MLQVEHARGRGVFLRFVLSAANNGGMTFKTHGFLSLKVQIRPFRGSGLARAGTDAVLLQNLSACIASKPAPTQGQASRQNVYFIENVA